MSSESSFGRWVVLLLAIALAVGARAQQSPESQVADTTDRILAAVEREREVIERDPGRLEALVDDIVLPHFDFRRMSQRVLGKHWRRATPEQQDRFTDQFKTLLVRTYATALQEYRGQKVKLLPSPQAAGASEVVVRTEVQQPGGLAITISYTMASDGGHWKVYDVTVDGVSLVINYRSSFNNEIRSGGVEGLIARLERHNRSAP